MNVSIHSSSLRKCQASDSARKWERCRWDRSVMTPTCFRGNIHTSEATTVHAALFKDAIYALAGWLDWTASVRTGCVLQQ